MYISRSGLEVLHSVHKQLNHGLLTLNNSLFNQFLINPDPQDLEYKAILDGTCHPNCQKNFLSCQQLSISCQTLPSKTAKFNPFPLN